MTVRYVLAAALLAGAGLLSTAPAATAACEPVPVVSRFCDGTVPPLLPRECWRDEHGIHCRY